MAEALGLAASVIAVVGLASQVVQGCHNIKGCIGDIKSAPKDVQDLMRELESVQASAKTAEQLGTKSEVDFQGELAPALRLCFEAVEEIRKKIVDADLSFKEKGSGKRTRGWHRLKVVFGKQAIQTAVDRLSRAKANLVVAQSNVLLHLNRSQQEQLNGMNGLLALGLQTSKNSASALDGVHEITQEIQSQVGNTATAVDSLSADMRGLIGVSQQSQITPYIVAAVERAMESVLQKHAFRAQETSRADHNSCISVHVAERGTPYQELNAARCRSHYHSKQELVCKNPLLTISKTISKAKVPLVEREDADGTENAPEAGPSHESITTYEVRVNLGLWRRGLRVVIGHSRNAYIPGRDFRLSTYHIVAANAPVFQAARALDIETVRALFLSGCASPFDQMPLGSTLFDWTFYWVCATVNLETAVRGFKLLKFILDCGGAPNSLGKSTWIRGALSNSNPLSSWQIFADAIRMMFEVSSNNPIWKWDLAISMTLKSERTPVGEFIRQQGHWPLELGPAVTETDENGGYSIYETDRQIFEDEDGLQLTPILPKSVRYTAISDSDHIIAQWGIHSILGLYGDSEFRQKIRTGCKNRITILLRAGYDPRGCDLCEVNLNSNGILKMSVTQYALWTKTSDLWQEALEDFGWSRIEIRDLFDEELYWGFPELLNGELEFRSQAENREKFLQVLAMGGYHGGYPSVLEEQLAIYINMDWFDIEKTINEARQIFHMKSTPGSWQEDGTTTLVLGVDIFLWGEPGDWERFASFEDYDKYLARGN